MPWKDWLEWQEVYQLLLKGDQSSHMRAFEAIRDWQSRGRVPIAVEATSLIIVSLMRDVGGYSDDGLADAEVIIRFVNLLTDLVQKGFYAASVETLANSIGIPSWIVQLRHTACHGSILPKASLLRRALLHLLNVFIIPKYWEAQIHELTSNAHLRISSNEQGDAVSSWTMSTLRVWIEGRLYGSPDETCETSIEIEQEGIYWIVVELKDYILSHGGNEEAHSEVLNDVIALMSWDCRLRLFETGLRYGNGDVIRRSMNDTLMRPRMQSVLLNEVVEYPVHYRVIASSAPPGHPAAQPCELQPKRGPCSGCYFVYDRLVDT